MASAAPLGVLIPGTDESLHALPKPALPKQDEPALESLDEPSSKTMARMLAATELREMCASRRPLAPRHAPVT